MSREPRPFALLAEDDPLIRMNAADILEAAGFQIYEASDVSEALAILATNNESIGLLFTDVQMPPGTLNGFDLAWECSRRWPVISILVASGRLAPKTGDLPDRAAFMEKPFVEGAIYERLQGLIPQELQPEALRALRR